MENFSWIYYFKPYIFWLKVVGLWPKNLSYKPNIYTLYSVIFLGFVMFLYTFVQTMEMFVTRLDLSSIASSLFVQGFLLMMIKTCVFLNKLPTIRKLLVTLDDPHFQPKDEAQVQLAQENFKLWTILYRMYLIGVNTISIIWSIRPLVDGSYAEHVLPFVAWYPFDTTRTPLYQVVYLHQVIGMLYTAYGHLHLESMCMGFCVCIGAQCDILCHELRRVKIVRDLKTCFEHYKRIYLFFADFNDFFNNIILVQLFVCMTDNALVFFNLSLTVPGSSDFYVLLLFCLVAPFELFLYCWFGNELELKSGNIAQAIYESQWIGTSKEFQKLMLLFAMKAQQPMSLTSMNVFPLSLKTYMAIMKASWSYFSVLHQLNSNKIEY